MTADRHARKQSKTAITNVRLFDGRTATGPATVVIDGDKIGNEETGARGVDGAGGTVLSGLIGRPRPPSRRGLSGRSRRRTVRVRE